MNNADIKKFYDDMLYLINHCGLQVGTAYFIMKDLLNELENAFYQSVNMDLQQTTEEITKTVPIGESQEMSFDIIRQEEMENEGTNTDVAEHSGSTNDN